MIKPISIPTGATRLILIFVFILTIFLRFYKLDQLPPGFTFDEASHAMDARDILHGHFSLTSPRLQQVPMGYMVLLAGAFAMFGESWLVQRVLTATCGCLLVGVNFVTMRILFSSQTATWSRADGVALFSSLLLASSLWAIHASRIGFEYILTPGLALVALGLFWRSYQSDNWSGLTAASAFIGLNFFTYVGSAPILLVIPTTFILYRWLAAESMTIRWRNIALVGLLSWLIVLPLMWLFLTGSTPEVTRTTKKLIFSPDINLSDSLSLLKLSLLAHGDIFLGLSGRGNLLSGMPDQPLLNPLLAIGFVVGIGISLQRYQQWPYLLLLVYWVGMIAPSILTFEDEPHYFRLISAMPATFAFVALTWTELYVWLGKRLTRFKQAEWLALTPFIMLGMIWLPWQAYQSYFIIWAHQPKLAEIFDISSVQLVRQMSQENDPQAIYLLPREANDMRHNYVLDFLYQGQAPLRYLPVDKQTIETTLTETLAHYRTIHFISYLNGAREDKHRDVVFEVVPFLLAKHGQLLNSDQNNHYRVQTYRLDSDQVDFAITFTQLPPEFEPTDLMVSAQVKIIGFRYQFEPQQAVVTLAWRGLNQLIMDYTVSVQLLNSQRQRVAGVDRLQRRGIVSLDSAEILPVDYAIPLTNLPPNNYTVSVVIYYFNESKESVPVGQIDLPKPLVLEKP